MKAKPIRNGLRAIAMTPLWLAQVLSVSKSYEANPILGNPILNRLGLHVVRLLLAHGVTRLRWLMLSPLVSPQHRRAFRTQGFLLISDCLPEPLFAQLADEVRNHHGDVRECIQGDTRTHRTLLDPTTLADLPACRHLVGNRRYRNTLQWAAARLGLPFLFIEQVRNGVVDDGGEDPQKNLHADTFHPTMKAWLYIDDVSDERGPFSYVAGSNRLTFKRVAWEYRQSVRGRGLSDRYARRGSHRLMPHDHAALDLPPVTRFTVPRNTLVVADTFGFHARSAAPAGSTRLAIYADSRTNPFNPWPGVDMDWATHIRYRAFSWLRARQDRRAERQGKAASWHRIAPSPNHESSPTDE